jgi:thioredoxin 1
MKKHFLTLVLSLLVIPVLAADFPEGSPKFDTSFDAALAKAKASGKPLVAVFSASYCVPCQNLKKDVYPSPEVTALHDQFEWVYVELEEPTAENEKAQIKYQVESVPSIMVIKPDGSVAGHVEPNAPALFAENLKTIYGKWSATQATQ